MNSIIVFRAICSFFIIIQFYRKNKRFLFYLQKSFGYLWDLWVIYKHLCSNLQFISLPEEVGEFLLYIMLKNNYCSEDLFEFVRDFRVGEISERKYINLSRGTVFIKNFASLCNLPLMSYFLSNGEIKKMLSHRF